MFKSFMNGIVWLYAAYSCALLTAHLITAKSEVNAVSSSGIKISIFKAEFRNVPFAASERIPTA